MADVWAAQDDVLQRHVAVKVMRPDPGHEDRMVTRFATSDNAASIIAGLGLGLAPVEDELRWTRSVPLDTHLDHLATHSALAVLPPEQSAPIIDAERESVQAEFPEGIVEERYVVRLVLVRAPGDGTAAA